MSKDPGVGTEYDLVSLFAEADAGPARSFA